MQSSAAVGIGVSRALQIGLWLTVLIIAFVMQVVPFLLVLTMFNLAIGITSGAALVIIPVAAFSMLSFACWIATRRAKTLLPAQQKPRGGPVYMADYNGRNGGVAPAQALSIQQRIVTHLRSRRWLH
ncbi:MAG: hypothetical protein OEU46_00680 [Alphaproteobacteria bacterium]|nr:hypothetical protein [Alphaproteobacteria bacterium]